MYVWNVSIGPINIAPYIVMIIGYIITILTSGIVFRLFIGTVGNISKEGVLSWRDRLFDVGTIIGKCENFIIITFVLNSEYTGLALIFTAKSIVRMDDIKKNTKYYLGGTLVNLCYSLLMGFIIKAVLVHTGYSL